MSEHRTYQTRLRVFDDVDTRLTDYATLYQKVERSLFARLQAGGILKDLKREFLSKYGITARQFNAAACSVQGKISAINELRDDTIQTLKQRICRAENVLKKGGTPRWEHEKKRRLYGLRLKLSCFESKKESGKISLCFGGKKLFRAQHHLVTNGFESHAEWQQAWHSARNNQFMVLGSNDETGGCQGCVASVDENGTLSLRLRLPDALGGEKYLWLHNVSFNVGHEAVVASLGRNLDQNKKHWESLTYRFFKDARGWRVMVTVKAHAPERCSVQGNGVLGVDLNADHLAVTETDRFGNPLLAHRIDCETRGKSKTQRQSVIGDAIKQVVAWSVECRKPLVIEKLDFSKKKAEAEARGVRRNRMLSGLAYAQIQMLLRARAFDAGIEVFSVNPAYTSVIGEYKFAARYGLSRHQAAALVIGRRSMSLSESVPSQLHVTFPTSVRTSGKHVWSQWAWVIRQARATHAALGKSVRGPPAKQVVEASILW